MSPGDLRRWMLDDMGFPPRPSADGRACPVPPRLVCEVLGIDRSWLYRLLKGTRAVSPDLAMRCADARVLSRIAKGLPLEDRDVEHCRLRTPDVGSAPVPARTRGGDGDEIRYGTEGDP